MDPRKHPFVALMETSRFRQFYPYVTAALVSHGIVASLVTGFCPHRYYPSLVPTDVSRVFERRGLSRSDGKPSGGLGKDAVLSRVIRASILKFQPVGSQLP
ncbi:hypothetical protein EVAR_32191_1 [Eumeta japonica]|uniref:Uncharacterized protein n=1 Tax=Eumeta variegata TaxID=151549 RepID=A0A4C1W0N8_EUMVA|nr:hypothetical protein EVAR_32191_1 [Eumeta japonica]